MHYYQFNITDWIADTRHLTLEEEAIYLRLICHYYDLENPIQITDLLLRKLMLCDKKDVVNMLLSEFFVKEGDVWLHNRCEKEIFKCAEKSSKARDSANVRWRKQKKDNASAMRAHSEGNANGMLPKTHNPLPKTQDTQPNKKTCANAQFDDFWKAYPIKRDKKKAKTAWMRKKLNGKSEDIVKDVINRISNDPQWIKGYIPLPTTYINGERWDDELTNPVIQEGRQYTEFGS